MRYIRQEKFIGKNKQKIVQNKTVAIVGLGALGSVASELLTRAGIKELILIDRDFIELSNLQRQSIFNEDDINQSKAFVLKDKLNKINKKVIIKAYFDNLDNLNINILKSDLILDCTDNFETRFLINEFCVKNKIPFIYGSAIGDSGYLFNIIPEKICFSCIFKEVKGLDSCETYGVLNSITHLIASLQVSEALKILTKQNYEENLIYFSLKGNELIKIKVNKNKNCETCVKNIFNYLNGEKNQSIIKFCGSSTYLFKGNYNLSDSKKKLKKENIALTDKTIHFGNIIIFKDKVLIKARDEKEAKSLYSKYIGN